MASKSGIPGLTLFERDGRKLCFSHGRGDLNDGHAHDAFHVYRMLECGGDWKTALEWNPALTAHNRRHWARALELEHAGELVLPADAGMATHDPLIGPPKPETMLYGLAGEVGRAAAVGTEVNPIAAAAGFLSFLGAMVGRDVYLPVGNTRHHARPYTLHVGRSARGRKGDALALTHCIRRALELPDPDGTQSRSRVMRAWLSARPIR